MTEVAGDRQLSEEIVERIEPTMKVEKVQWVVLRLANVQSIGIRRIEEERGIGIAHDPVYFTDSERIQLPQLYPQTERAHKTT